MFLLQNIDRAGHWDPAIWAWRLERRRQNVVKVLSTRFTYAAAAAWGIEMLSGCRFYGRPILRRVPGSTLTIGESCLFLSAPWSNSAGLNRPCFLATLREGAVLAVGDESGFSGTVVAAANEIVIGRRVLCGANVTITDTDRHGLRSSERANLGLSAAVSVEDDVWLGMNVTVLKGVRIGRGTVVAAGSLVTRSLPQGVIAAGNPARVLRSLD